MYGSAFFQIFVLEPLAATADQYRFEHLEDNVNIRRDILTGIPVETAKAVNGGELHSYFADGLTQSVHSVPADNSLFLWAARILVGGLFLSGAILVV